MAQLPTNVAEFLSHNTIAVAGVSRESNQPANLIYRKLRDGGHTVYAVNPNATQVEGTTCYPNLRSVPEKVGAVVIVVPPGAAAQVVRDCAELGIHHVWFHRSFGQGSVSEEALQECKRLGISSIEGGCPMMYCEPVDFGHRCMKWVLKLQHRVPA